MVSELFLCGKKEKKENKKEMTEMGWKSGRHAQVTKVQIKYQDHKVMIP